MLTADEKGTTTTLTVRLDKRVKRRFDVGAASLGLPKKEFLTMLVGMFETSQFGLRKVPLQKLHEMASEALDDQQMDEWRKVQNEINRRVDQGESL